MRPSLAAIALLLSLRAAASAALTPALNAQVAGLRSQIASSKFAPELIRELTVAADKIEDAASFNAVQAAFQTCHFGGQMPAKFYQAKLAALQPRIAALGETAYFLEPKLSEVKNEIKQRIPIDQIVDVDRDWHEFANGKMGAAEARAKSNAALQAQFHAKIAAFETTFLSMPRDEAAAFQKYEKAELAPMAGCNGRCDDAWRKALIVATADLDSRQAAASSIVAICANIKSQADPIKAMMPHAPAGMAKKVQPLLDAVYSTLAAGPVKDAQAALAALLNVKGSVQDEPGNNQPPAGALTVAPGTPDADVLVSQPSAGALTTAPKAQ